MRTVWILGDQLHDTHPALARVDRTRDRVLFIESRRRSEQFRYHQIKLALVFSAMRHRAAALREEGWQVDYVEQCADFVSALEDHVRAHRPEAILVQAPSQYDFMHGLPALSRKLGVPIEVVPENQFLVSREESPRGRKITTGC